MDEIAGLGIIVSIFVSCIGFVFFSYGRKMSRAPQTLGGLILLVFPYFISSVAWMGIITLLVILGIWWAVKLGW